MSRQWFSLTRKVSFAIILVLVEGGAAVRKVLVFFFSFACLLLCALPVQARDISGTDTVSGYTGFVSLNRLFDGRNMESNKIKSGGTITLASEDGISGVYLEFGIEYGSFLVTDEGSGETKTVGETGYLHEFVDLEKVFGYIPSQVTVCFDHGDVELAEVSVFSPGEIPDWVQRWDPPAEAQADLVLFSTHGDDEQLFFAGMLPYYAWEMGYNVQVVYMTDHRNMTTRRCHEMLDGLWAVGVRCYPVFGTFGDYHSQSLSEAYQIYRQKGISREDILAFVVENVRRFRPKVAVGHDLLGEYGHGMHMIYAELLCEAVNSSQDASLFPESAEKYGVWDVPKTYLHLYPENQVLMDWDIPLESFDGMTAYEVTKELGFPCHESQQSYYSWYFDGIDYALAIREYSPCRFGLYRSTVGEDTRMDDFFENVTTYGEDARLEEELLAQMQEQEAPQMQTEAPTKPMVTEPEVLQEMPEKNILWEIMYKIRKFLGFAP